MKISTLLLSAACAGATSIVYSAASSDPLAPIGVALQPPPPPVRPVTEDHFGTKVTDNYRYMEKLAPETLDWMKAQGAYTRKALDAIAPHAALRQRVETFSGSFGFVQNYGSYGARQFYQERTPGSDDFELIVKDEKGRRKLVDIGAIRAAHGGEPFAINFFLPAPDGSKVAVGISQGGSEDAQLYVYDATSGKQIAGPIDRAEYGVSAWSGDSRLLYVNRLQKVAKGDEINKYKNVTVQLWDLKSAPLPIAGNGIGTDTAFEPDEAPAIDLSAESPIALLISRNGVQHELKLWRAPAASASSPSAPWKPLAERSDRITNYAIRGNEVFLLSVKNAPTGQVLRVQGDTVQILQPWGVDPGRAFCPQPGRRLAAEGLDRGLKMAVGIFPTGLPAGSVVSRPS